MTKELLQTSRGGGSGTGGMYHIGDIIDLAGPEFNDEIVTLEASGLRALPLHDKDIIYSAEEYPILAKKFEDTESDVETYQLLDTNTILPFSWDSKCKMFILTTDYSLFTILTSTNEKYDSTDRLNWTKDNNWTVPANTLGIVKAYNANRYWAVTLSGATVRIYKSDDTGVTWVSVGSINHSLSGALTLEGFTAVENGERCFALFKDGNLSQTIQGYFNHNSSETLSSAYWTGDTEITGFSALGTLQDRVFGHVQGKGLLMWNPNGSTGTDGQTVVPDSSGYVFGGVSFNIAERRTYVLGSPQNANQSGLSMVAGTGFTSSNVGTGGYTSTDLTMQVSGKVAKINGDERPLSTTVPGFDGLVGGLSVDHNDKTKFYVYWQNKVLRVDTSDGPKGFRMPTVTNTVSANMYVVADAKQG